MPERSDIAYLYDGTFEGLLCCIFESYLCKELPMEIYPQDAAQTTFYQQKTVETDIARAERVRKGIQKTASHQAYHLAELGFLTCHPKKELLLLDFVRLCMQCGGKVLSMLADDTVNQLQNAVKALTRESHQFKGFVRFSEYDKVLISVIEPKNFVLPLLAPHFSDRYPNEAFMIYDKTHKQALLYKPRETVIVHAEDFHLPTASEKELRYRSLWKLFYDTITIEERYNPKCRMSHMQKRYWNNLTEMTTGKTEPSASLTQLHD